ncbi:MAG: DUF6049 family protein [Nocardioidaceae bacterium]
MTRPTPRRAVACLLAVLAAAAGTAVLAPTPRAAAAEDTTQAPLRVSVETLAPAVVPTSGRVTLTGQVTNRSSETYTDLKAYLFTSAAPITDRAALAEAVSTPEDASIGTRVTSPGLYDELGDLDPGATLSYRVSVPRANLGISGQPGVYWIGVHVLGTDPDGVRSTAGRARSFIPLVPRTTTPTRLALVVPVKNEVRRGAAGRLLGIGSWQRTLSPEGRLDRLLNLSGRATSPITWVLDPAVLDAARSVAQDNPKLDPGPTTAGSADPSGSPSASASPSDGPSDGSPDAADVGPASEPSPEAVSARAWLEELRRQAPSHTIASVPYGDLDVAATLGTRLRGVYRQALDLSTQALTSHGIERSIPVVEPINGRLPNTALRAVDPISTVLLGDGAFPRAQRPVLNRAGLAPVVRTDEDAGSGGPLPNARYAALAVRQRLLGDAALHALSADADEPLVVSTPPYWNPGKAWAQADFFAGLDQPWLRMVDLPSVVSSATPPPDGDTSGETAATYPRSDRETELPLANLLATERLTSTGTTYGRMLVDNETVEGVLSRTAMLASSQNVRNDADRALSQVNSTNDYVRGQMQGVRIEGPSFVMMSSETGPIQVTLVNGLDQTVKVGVATQTRSSGLTIEKVQPRTLGPGQRTAIRLQASSNDIGVHAVTLVTTDAEGNPLGSLTQVSVRSSRVSTVIWVIMAAGGVLLFVAIAVRLFRRVRRRKSTHGPRLPREPEPPTTTPTPEPGDASPRSGQEHAT